MEHLNTAENGKKFHGKIKKKKNSVKVQSKTVKGRGRGGCHTP